MDHYLDLRMRPDPEVATAHILNTVAGKLHLALARLQSQDIGISFPRFRLVTLPPNDGPPAADGTRQQWKPTLGDTLRLHGRHERLRELMALGWLAGLDDYVAAEDARPVPPGAQHRVVTRRQTHSNADRIRRRQMKRHGLTEQQAQARIPDAVEKRLALPFLQLRSHTNGHAYHLFIEHLACRNEATPGAFNTYGLSACATVPWF